MKRQKKTVPEFQNLQEEQKFWETHDSTEYIDWDKAAPALFPELKPSMKTISLRIPEPMLDRLKILASQRDVPYQSLMKMFLKERIDHEIKPG